MALLIICGAIAFSQNRDNDSMNLAVMTYNIRYDNPDDGVNRWDNRKEHVTSLIQKYDPDIIGIQEALKNQIDDLNGELTNYKWIGVGRDDGKEKGEYSPIFYNTDKLDLSEWGTFWLSETPSTPSKSWDAALPRICTWARLVLKSDGRSILVFNTHFDHRGSEARKESSKLIIQKIQELVNTGDNAILTGDFNQTPDSEGYSSITSYLHDTFKISKSGQEGPIGTFSGFNVDGKIGNRIDYIFVAKSMICEKYYALIDQNQDHYPSDHLPVLAKLQLK